MMPDDLVLIKFGGSLITEKSIIRTARMVAINRLVKMCSEIISLGKKLIIVHGAGSFGHIKAKELKIFEGKDDILYKKQLLGIEEIRNDMMTLNQKIVDAMKNNKLEPETYTPHKEGKGSGLNYIFSEKIDMILKLNKIPVVYGDVVDLDNSKEFGILSGDDICEILSKRFTISHIIFAIDGADGIIDNPDSDDGGKLIENFSFDDEVIVKELEFDVTGGMNLKIMRGINCFKQGSRVSIINGNDTEMIINAIKGLNYRGTEFI